MLEMCACAMVGRDSVAIRRPLLCLNGVNTKQLCSYKRARGDKGSFVTAIPKHTELHYQKEWKWSADRQGCGPLTPLLPSAEGFVLSHAQTPGETGTLQVGIPVQESEGKMEKENLEVSVALKTATQWSRTKESDAPHLHQRAPCHQKRAGSEATPLS